MLQDSELKAVMAAADADGNGLIDYDEFIASTVNLNKLERYQVRSLQRIKHPCKNKMAMGLVDEPRDIASLITFLCIVIRMHLCM